MGIELPTTPLPIGERRDAKQESAFYSGAASVRRSLAQELIADISSRLVVNRAAMKMKHARVRAILEHMAAATGRAVA